VLVTLDDIKVMFLVSPSGPQGAGEAFDRLEARLPSLKGRKFYGTLLNGEYRACVALEAQDAPATMGLESWTIPGGAYARRKLERWPERLPEIGQIFGALAAEYPRDSARPNVEFYRSQKELILFMAVASPAEGRAPDPQALAYASPSPPGARPACAASLAAILRFSSSGVRRTMSSFWWA